MPLTKDLRWSNIDLVFRESHICSLVVTYLERHFSSGLMKTWSVLVFLIYALEFFFRNKPWFLFHQTILRNFVFDLFNTYSKWLNEEKKYIVLYFDTCWYGKLLHKYQIYFFFVNMQYICTIRWSFIGLRK